MGVIFHGEVSNTELISGPELINLTDVTEGVTIYEDTDWLHFTLDGIELFVTIKPIRHSISWNHLNSKNLITGNRTLTISGRRYKIRLLKTATYDPMKYNVINFGGSDHLFDNNETHGSEWNRLMYPIHNGIHVDSANPAKHTDPFSLPFGTLGNYSDDDLNLATGPNDIGRRNWCDGTYHNGSGLNRGWKGVTRHVSHDKTSVAATTGWRPVLELVN